MASSKLNELLNTQKNTEVTYKDESGKSHKRKITLQEPSARASALILDNMAAAGGSFLLGNVMELVMENVIISPKLNYEVLNKSLPEDLQSKEVEFDTPEGKKFAVKLKFPDFKTALNITTTMTKADGAFDFSGEMDALLDNVLFDKEDHRLKWDDFNPGSPLVGKMNDVIKEANEYLNDVLAHDGVAEILGAGFRLVQKQIGRIR